MENELLLKELLLIRQDIAELKSQSIKLHVKPTVLENWIPLDDIKEWISYGNTQTCEFLKTEGLTISQIGRRKFINRDSLNKLLEKNILKNHEG